MGLFDKLFGRQDKRAVIVEPGMIVLRRKELVERMERPKQPNFSDEPQGPCEQCGKPLEETFITTGGALGDRDLWRDHPVAVDGWACLGCGVFRYPRRVGPDAITALAREGVEHGQAGRFADAEWCFARIVWNWPGYIAGHVNYAEALRERLAQAPPDDAQVKRRVTQRMIEQYEEAIDRFVAEPTPPDAVGSIARACLTLVDLAIKDRALDRASRYVEICLALPGLPEDAASSARGGREYLATRHDLFDDASNVLGDRIRLSGRPARPPATPDERAQIVRAIENLEHHIRLAPDRWQAAWLHAKALHLLGKHAEAFDTWRRASERFPAERNLARDYSLELLEADRVSEARAVARAITERHPKDATLWCNLAVAEVLSNDLDAAEAALERSHALDPSDRIAKLITDRVREYRRGKPVPRTLRGLQAG